MADITPKLHQAQQLLDQGRYEQARDLLQRLVRQAPTDRNVNVLMRHALARLGQSQQALYYADRALASAPDDADLIALNAMTLADCGRIDEAIKRLEPCVLKQPRHALARATLARLYGVQERLGDCLKTCLVALHAGESDARVLSIYASALLRIGRADEAVPIMKQLALLRAQGGGSADPHQVSGLAAAMLYDQTAKAADIFAAHYAYGRLLTAELPAGAANYAQAFDPERPIRVGIVSPDLRNHPSQRFVEPILEHLDKSRHELYVYSVADRDDEVTARFKAYGGQWRSASRWSARELAERILADRIDVLIDTAGHTQGNRLLAFHLRPAPVQATWLGYPATTGLTAMDYRIVDSLTDPLDTTERSTEKLARLDPCFVCYRPPQDAPEINPVPPSARTGGWGDTGGITFVSFNAVQKVNIEVASLWGRILREVRGSRVVIRHRATLQKDVRDHLAQRLMQAGASREQVIVQEPAADSTQTMAGYHDADVALDTFPYPGVTTTCEALWMGVPVVSLTGPSSVSRQGHSILHAAGLSDCIAETPDRYVAIAAALAADVQRRTDLRQNLRATLNASALRDEKGYVRKFENTLRSMWRERCASAK